MPARITTRDNIVFVNKHLTVQQPTARLFEVWNNPVGADHFATLRDTAASLQGIAAQARQAGVRARGLGGAWSISDVAATEGWLINTNAMRWTFDMTAATCAPGYPDPARLLFAQGGTQIAVCNQYLAARGRSLRASGASNGQTIAGAIATGTHGSGIATGAIHDAVVGLHLLTGTASLWVERQSQPVVSDAFIAALGATPLRNDAAFEAILVGLGAFGLVNAVLIETDPIYLLEAQRWRRPLDATLRNALNTLDFTGVGLPYPNERPWHFEMVANPHDLQNGVWITTLYRRPYRPDYPRMPPPGNGYAPGEDALSAIGGVTNWLPQTIRPLMTQLMNSLYQPYPPRWGTLGEQFRATTTRGASTGMAFGLPIARASQAMDVALAVQRQSGPYPSVVAFRYLPVSRGTMAFTRFAPMTAIMDLDGVNSALTRTYYDRVCQAMAAAGIPFTLHWGKHNTFLNAQRVRTMYGGALDSFLAVRRQLLPDPGMQRVFSSPFLDRCGLSA
ncbi:MAG TPA: FAD-binding protein [Longimicrobiaceae bacterium]|nr:FAD-binding protein [Longimicrobiaceae bacterium]